MPGLMMRGIMAALGARYKDPLKMKTRGHTAFPYYAPSPAPSPSRVGLFTLFGIDDLEPLAPFGPLDRMPGPPAVKDDRHGMALALAIARQVTDQCLPLGFHVAPQAPSHPKQVVAVDDEMDRHGQQAYSDASDLSMCQKS